MISVLIDKVDILNHYRIKIQDQDWELNIHLTEQELELLKQICSADWGTRQSIRAGISANAPVFWAYDDDREMVSILVGHDDETWDFGVILPLKNFIASLAAVNNETENGKYK